MGLGAVAFGSRLSLAAPSSKAAREIAGGFAVVWDQRRLAVKNKDGSNRINLLVGAAVCGAELSICFCELAGWRANLSSQLVLSPMREARRANRMLGRATTPSFSQEPNELVGIVRARFRSALRKLRVKALQGRFDRLHPLRCGELNGQLRGRIMQDISRVR